MRRISSAITRAGLQGEALNGELVISIDVEEARQIIRSCEREAANTRHDYVRKVNIDIAESLKAYLKPRKP